MTIKQKNTTITIDMQESNMLTSRIIDNKVYKFPMDLDGTVGDMSTKVARVSKLCDEDYAEFARIYKTSLEVDEAHAD